MRIIYFVVIALLLVACDTSSTTSIAEFEGTRFSYDHALATDITVHTISETIAVANEEWNLPQYTLYALKGYSPQRKSEQLQPRIEVYPIEDFKRVNPFFSKRGLPDLISVLNQKPLTLSNPALPLNLFFPWAYKQVSYLNFQNGSGVRFVVYLRGQSIEPIANSSLVYVFLGITGDAKYYVLAIFPVDVPFLPPSPSSANPAIPTVAPNGVNFEQRMQSINRFNDETLQRMETLQAEDFVPNLKLLDAMVSSLEAK